jgi:membrane-bound lytic murein transglycosylase B
VIPDRAVEAAAEAIEYALQTGVGVKDIARDALEAAAPYLMRAAWDEGKSSGWDAARGEPEESNPYEAATK